MPKTIFPKFKNSFLIILFSVFLFAPLVSFAQSGANLGINYAQNLGLTSANDQDPRDLVISIVRYLMTFLGIIAVIVILYGGFMWMTAAGNEDRVDKAKKIIIAGAIGLVIVLAAFAITTFVINLTNDALNGDAVDTWG